MTVNDCICQNQVCRKTAFRLIAFTVHARLDVNQLSFSVVIGEGDHFVSTMYVRMLTHSMLRATCTTSHCHATVPHPRRFHNLNDGAINIAQVSHEVWLMKGT